MKLFGTIYRRHQAQLIGSLYMEMSSNIIVLCCEYVCLRGTISTIPDHDLSFNVCQSFRLLLLFHVENYYHVPTRDAIVRVFIEIQEHENRGSNEHLSRWSQKVSLCEQSEVFSMVIYLKIIPTHSPWFSELIFLISVRHILRLLYYFFQTTSSITSISPWYPLSHCPPSTRLFLW